MKLPTLISLLPGIISYLPRQASADISCNLSNSFTLNFSAIRSDPGTTSNGPKFQGAVLNCLRGYIQYAAEPAVLSSNGKYVDGLIDWCKMNQRLCYENGVLKANCELVCNQEVDERGEKATFRIVFRES